TAGGGTISLSGATLPVTSNCTFGVSVKAVAGGTQNNTTSNVTSNETPSGGTATASINVLSADLAISKTHSGPVILGRSGFVYTIVVSNVGRSPSTGTVTVTDSLPARMTAAAMSGTGWTCTLSTLTCT